MSLIQMGNDWICADTDLSMIIKSIDFKKSDEYEEEEEEVSVCVRDQRLSRWRSKDSCETVRHLVGMQTAVTQK